jgi:hypothetical protein
MEVEVGVEKRGGKSRMKLEEMFLLHSVYLCLVA